MASWRTHDTTKAVGNLGIVMLNDGHTAKSISVVDTAVARVYEGHSVLASVYVAFVKAFARLARAKRGL